MTRWRPYRLRALQQAITKIWTLHRKLCAERGLDLGEALAGFVVRQRAFLRSCGADREFQDLVIAGCEPQLLALLCLAVGWAPKLNWIRRAIGAARRRDQLLRTLDKSAKMIEPILEGLGLEFQSPSWTVDSEIVDIRTLYLSLLTYAEALRWEKNLASEVGELSFVDIGKYLLANYVKTVTGKYHDREVSALIGAKLGNADYYETSHKAWRHRNHHRLGHAFSELARFLFAIHSVLWQQK
jgi:hypothetical protein